MVQSLMKVVLDIANEIEEKAPLSRAIAKEEQAYLPSRTLAPHHRGHIIQPDYFPYSNPLCGVTAYTHDFG